MYASPLFFFYNLLKAPANARRHTGIAAPIALTRHVIQKARAGTRKG